MLRFHFIGWTDLRLLADGLNARFPKWSCLSTVVNIARGCHTVIPRQKDRNLSDEIVKWCLIIIWNSIFVHISKWKWLNYTNRKQFNSTKPTELQDTYISDLLNAFYLRFRRDSIFSELRFCFVRGTQPPYSTIYNKIVPINYVCYFENETSSTRKA